MVDLTNDEQITISKEIERLRDPVRIKVALPAEKNEFITDLKALLEQVAKSDERMTLEYEESDEEADPDDDLPKMLPCISILDTAGADHGIFFYGTPLAGALPAFVRSIVMISNQQHDLPQDIVDRAKALGETKMEVLITPNAPGCAQAMMIANSLAYATGTITAHSIELIEFPQVAERYNVLGVPKTVANRSLKFTGSYSLEEVVQILEKKISDVED
jgi:alkyl hydroperoxide reductase subunit AhpF